MCCRRDSWSWGGVGEGAGSGSGAGERACGLTKGGVRARGGGRGRGRGRGLADPASAPKIARARVRFAPLKGWTIKLPGAEGKCPAQGYLISRGKRARK